MWWKIRLKQSLLSQTEIRQRFRTAQAVEAPAILPAEAQQL
jgi:hypothetical protein